MQPSFNTQSLSWHLREKLEIIVGSFWAGLILCLGRRKWVSLCTNRLFQRRYKAIGDTRLRTCTGANSPPLSPFLRLKDEWVVGYIKGGLTTTLKAGVGHIQSQPPTTGWKYYGYDDEYLSCTTPTSTPSCSLTVSLSGAAKEAHGKCEGEYKSIGLTSAGRPVIS